MQNEKEIATKAIVADNTQGFMLINESDFDKKTMKEFEGEVNLSTPSNSPVSELETLRAEMAEMRALMAGKTDAWAKAPATAVVEPILTK